MSLRPEDEIRLDALLARTGREAHRLVAMLLAVQREWGYLPAELLDALCERTEVSPSACRAVSTFYGAFRHEPVGRHRIKVCIGTACHVKRADRVFDAFRHHLAIPDGEDTDAEGRFTVEKVACLGCCMLAPAVQIDEVVYGWVEPARVAETLEDFLASAAAAGEEAGPPTGDPGLAELKICTCSSCAAAGADAVYAALRRGAREHGIPLRLHDVGCTGLSFRAPMIELRDRAGRVFHYGCVEADAVASILLHHFAPRSVARWVDRLLSGGHDPVYRHRIEFRSSEDARWLDGGPRIVTEGCGAVAPLDLPAYRARQGFEGLERALALPPEDLVAAIEASGLRGRGGAGFPTGRKWRAVAEAVAAAGEGAWPHLVCNADEGDPGAFMDRMLLESFPFRVLEGMLIAARAVGAREGRVYVRHEYPLAVSRLAAALEICRAAGLLGPGALGEGHDFDVELVEGAGAFVCGEETALIASIEGRRPIPRPRPPYPATEGLFGRPTLINNVETFAAVPWILRQGPEAFRAMGSAGSPGSKTFALAGKTLRGGLIEVPMGMDLEAIIRDYGGGVAPGRRVKAVQIGGPSGGCLPPSLFHLPVDYEALVASGAIMGSGGLVVLDDTDCMVDVARYFLRFTASESCGTCTGCRLASRRMLEILEDLCAGRGRADDLERLEELAGIMTAGSRCGLGRTAANPVLTTMKHFREEYEAHRDGRCPAGVCRALASFVVSEDCTGCMLCARGCPVEAIPFDPWKRAAIDGERCIRCGACRQICPEGAIAGKGAA